MRKFFTSLGLLLDDEVEAIRAWLNGTNRKKLIVLYDGRCGLCQKSILFLTMTDWLHRLQFENLHDASVRAKYSPTISKKALELAMHVVLPNKKIVQGFYSFREICQQVPMLWIIVPLLYLSPVPMIGKRVYAWMAGHRK